MSHRRAALYLQIPATYCRSFGGLRWAQYGEVVEFLDGPEAGRTFVFAGEIAPFLEGLMADGGPCPAFGMVLHLLYMLGLGDRSASPGKLAWLQTGRLAVLFRDQGNPLRNAGALFSHVLREIPASIGVPDPPAIEEVLELLRGGGWLPQMVLSHPMLGAIDYAEQPAAEALAFESMISSQLDALSDEAIRHWLQFGRGPLDTGNDLALPLPPSDLSEALAKVAERPRLAGLIRLIDRLDGALSLPPRRLDHDGPQSDGYSDLATRGQPEQILPIQLALEPEEFLRRFAERELLYYHRERPTRPVVQELVLVLDQGVRTWGDVRLALAGATMALARRAGLRRLAVRLATTGRDGEAVDPATLDAEALGKLLEASDLTPNPSWALDRILSVDRETIRDVVLLTHPRTLVDREVREVAEVIRPGDPTRLFAVTVASNGEVELAEVRGGRPIGLSRCRIDLSEREIPPAPVPAGVVVTTGPRHAWRGPVEKIPMPFRTGILSKPRISGAPGCRLVDFDESGDRLLVIMRHRLLYSFRLDGSDAEFLPRPVIAGDDAAKIFAVIGVAGGFVLVSEGETGPILFHYNFETRTCRHHSFHRFDRPEPIFWTYYADLHTIVGGIGHELESLAIDLTREGPDARAGWRTEQAIQRSRENNPWRWPSAISFRPPFAEKHSLGGKTVALVPETGTLRFWSDTGETRSLTPTRDGRPALRGARILSIQRGEDVLTLQLEAGSRFEIWFVSMARTAVIGTFTASHEGSGQGWFSLSRDGSRFARRAGDDQVEVGRVPGDDSPIHVTPREPAWNHIAWLGRSCLLVRESDRNGLRSTIKPLLIRWDGERLVADQEDALMTFHQFGGPAAESRSLTPRGAFPDYHHARFNQVIEHGSLRILVDPYNHLAVLDRAEDRLVAIFYVSGNEFAAWMPDGTLAGSRRLIGGEPTKAAAERIAAALRRAERGAGGLR